MLKILATTFMAAALFLPSSSLAQSTPSYRAGLKNFAIPAPTSDLVETGPDYRVFAESLVPTNNRLIAAFIAPADLDALLSKGEASLNRYALVEVPRRAEFTDVTPDQFKQIADSVATQFGSTFNSSLKEQQDEINRRLKALNAKASDIALDKPVELGTLFNGPNAYAYGMIMPLTSNGTTKKMAMGMIVLRVQSRVLFIFTYTEYKDESSVEWIRTLDEEWANAILQANK